MKDIGPTNVPSHSAHGAKTWRCCAPALAMTRHPVSGAARERAVSAREPVETRAAKEKIPPSGCRPVTAG